MLLKWLSLLYLVIEAKTQRLDVRPSHIEPGTTENLFVNCSLNVAKTPELAFINSLILSRSVDMNKSDYQVVASINSVDGRLNVYDFDGVGSGVISNKGESYLCVQWAYPVNEMAGSYSCEANGMSLTWKPKTFSVSAEISSSYLSQSTIIQLLRSSKLENIQRIEEIKKLTKEIKIAKDHINILEDNATISTNFINKVKDENKEALLILFFESSVYNGRRYYLAKESALVTYTSAQVTCAKYGGYLAEIDDDAEFNFIRKFVINYAWSVLISGSDEGHEGYWSHARNNTEIKFIKWLKGEPNGGNCLGLWRDGDSYFIDIPCVFSNIGLTFSYLCEIPNQ